MQRLVWGLLLLALLGAGATVWLVGSYIDRRIEITKKSDESSQASRVVLVAKANIPIGKKIERGDLDWIAWPDSGVQGNFLAAKNRDPKLEAKMVGTVARRGIIKGTPMTEAAVFRSTTPGFLAGALDPNMRAVSISITPESGASGFIMPGDRVDVILMQDVKRNLTGKAAEDPQGEKPYLRYTAETVLHGLRVLAVDQKVDDFDKKAQIGKTVTLEVTPKQAETLAVARAMGKLGLALRSLHDEKLVVRSGSGPAPGAASRMGGATEVVAESSSTGEAMEKAARDISDEAPTATTDLQISPILAGSVATAGGPGGPPTPPEPLTTRGPQKPTGTQIRIYRGGQPSTVNF